MINDMKLVRRIKYFYLRDRKKLFLIVFLAIFIESYIVTEYIYNNGLLIDTDFNFPLNKEGAWRWIKNNLDGYTYDIRSANRIFFGVIFLLLYNIYDCYCVFKYIFTIIITLSIVFTFLFIINLIELINNRNNSILDIIGMIVISHLIIYNNFTLFSRFFTLSNLIFIYIYIPLELYLTIKIIVSKRIKYMLLLIILNTLNPFTHPVYYAIIFLYSLSIALLLRLYHSYDKIAIVRILIGSLPTFIIMALYIANIFSVVNSYLNSNPLQDLHLNAISYYQFFFGKEYPGFFWQYCVSEYCYPYNMASIYYNRIEIFLIYIIKFIILAIFTIKFGFEKLFISILMIYLSIIFIISNPEILSLNEYLVIAFRNPYYRLAFPILISEIILFSFIVSKTKKRFLKLLTISYLLFFILIYYKPIYTGMIFTNTPLFNFHMGDNEIITLVYDIRIINNMNGPILYIPYSNNSYFVCMILNNRTVYYSINPLYLFSDKDIYYNSAIIKEKGLKIIPTISKNFIVVIEKYSCMFSQVFSKFDDRTIINYELLLDNCKRYIVNNSSVIELYNYIVINIKCD
jgi:hypothetical protein